MFNNNLFALIDLFDCVILLNEEIINVLLRGHDVQYMDLEKIKRGLLRMMIYDMDMMFLEAQGGHYTKNRSVQDDCSKNSQCL